MSDSTRVKGKDRRLGDEWRDWDGRSRESTEAGKHLFFGLSAGLLLMTALLALLGWYFIAPRIHEWSPLAPWVLLGVLLAAVSFFLIALAVFAFLAWREMPIPALWMALVRLVFSHTDRGVLALGRKLGIDGDRIAHSMIRVQNALARLADPRAVPEEVLVLLPRCLTKKHLDEARRLAAQYRVRLAVVPGGELARRHIAELRPRTVIGVACERDLISGIRDMGFGTCVFGIPNTRPNGPCKDTLTDMAQLEATIALCVGAPSSANGAADTRGGRSAAAVISGSKSGVLGCGEDGSYEGEGPSAASAQIGK